MNYQKIYDQIISRAKNRERPECYCENHHIIPKSMGGIDSGENIVSLTAKEHFIAHWLLKKIHNNKQMIYAFHAMTKPVGNGRDRYTSRSFKYAREAMARWVSENRSGDQHPLYGLRGKSSPNYGKKRSEKTKRKLSKKAIERFALNDHPNSVKIICVETGEVFRSISDAKKTHTKGNISYALSTGGTAGGFKFRYVSDSTGEQIIAKTTLKGYASGSRAHNSLAVVDQWGNKFDTYRSAGKSIGATGPAIGYAIKNGRPCKGVMFYKTGDEHANS